MWTLEQCVDYSAHHALVNAGGREIVPRCERRRGRRTCTAGPMTLSPGTKLRLFNGSRKAPGESEVKSQSPRRFSQATTNTVTGTGPGTQAGSHHRHHML